MTYDFIIRNDDTLESAEKKLQNFMDNTSGRTLEQEQR